MSNTVEIEGIHYELREPKQVKLSSGLTMILMMSMLIPSVSGIISKNEPERPRVNIVEEYKLILQKKSKLSRRQRDWVEYQFKKQYKQI